MSSPLRIRRFLQGNPRPSSASRRRRGSVLIIVVGLLVLMAVIGTAYVSTARVDRGAAATGTFNTQIDLLVQGVEAMAQTAIWQDVTTNFWKASSTPANYTSPTQQTFLGSRTPVMINGNPGWLYISAAPINNGAFESPYNLNGTSAAPAVLQYGQQRQGMIATSVPITDPVTGSTVIYPALQYYNNGTLTGPYLAASAAGDGIADSALFRLPCGEINGVTYYAAVRIIDNNSAVNASTAWTNNSSPTSPNVYGDFFPSDINLQALMVADGATGLANLNVYRCNGAASPSLQPIDDNGSPRFDFKFVSPYDALWMQLGRRLCNPGYISSGAKYQALPMTECGTLAYHFCLPNPMSSPSVLEQAFLNSLRPASLPGTPYPANQFLTWYNQNFNYSGEMPGSYMPRRALTTARNGISNFTLSKTDQGTYNPATSYNFGDVVQLTPGGIRYGCIDPTPGGIAPVANATTQYWTPEPWVNHITKTAINTATFDQLWLAYWNAMTDPTGNVPANTANAMNRNPIRASQSVSNTGGSTVAGGGSSGNGTTPTGNIITLSPSGGDDTGAIQSAINGSSPNDTIEFTSGTFKVSQMLTFLSNRTYLGAGGAGITITTPPVLTPAETLKMRAALVAANAQTLRGGGTNVVSQLIYLGTPASGGTVTTATGPSGGVTILHWAGGSNSWLMTTDTTSQKIKVEGLTFDGAGVKVDGHATNVDLIGDTIQNISTNNQDGIFDTGLYIPGGFVNSQFVGCTISGLPDAGGEATQIYNCDQGTQITDDTFNNAWNGLHITFANQGTGTVVSRNVCHQIGRNAIEIQGNPNGLTVSDNYIDQWVKQVGTPGDAHMAYSIATGGWSGTSTNGNNITLSNNVAIGNGDPNMGTPPQPGINFTAFEIMGTNVTCTGNYTSNMGTAQLMDNGTEPTTWSTTNNIWCGLTGCTNGQTTGSPVIDGTAPSTNTGNQTYVSANAVAPTHGPLNKPPSIPSVSGSGGGSTTQPTTNPATTQPATMQLSAMVYGTARNPYITEVYADNDSTLPAAYVAVELYNPYSTPISLLNWQLATVSRTSGNSLSLIPLPSTAAWQTAAPTIPAGGYLTLVSGTTPPTAYAAYPPTDTGTGSTSQVVVLDDLGTALNNELVLLRPRNANGTLTNDPNGTYLEQVNGQENVSDLVPVDSYDFTGLTYPSDPASTTGGTNPAREWYYVRPNDPTAQKNWHFVYPGPYTPAIVGSGNPCFTATQVGDPGTKMPAVGTTNPGLSSFGKPDAIGSYQDVPLQLDDDQVPGPNPTTNLQSGQPSAVNYFPFGAFARNGDILQAPFIGSYRIQDANPQAGTIATVYELNPVTIDATYAKAFDPTQDKVIPNENIGRFTPIYPASASLTDPTAPNDYTPTAGTAQSQQNSIPGNWTVYHFTTDLFDYLTVDAPVNWTPSALTPPGNVTMSASSLTSNNPDSTCLPNVDPNPTPNGYPGQSPAAVTTLKNPAFNPNSQIDDTVPLEGLININTAPWPVLATLPMVNVSATGQNAVANANLAKAIVYFRDIDDGTVPGVLHPHGPFKSIWELNEVAVNTPSINGGTLGASPPTPPNDATWGSIYNQPISFLNTLGQYTTNNYLPATTPGSNEAGDLSPQGASNNVFNDFESQNLALTRISNLITTRSDTYTVYVIVQGWRNVGTASPSLVVQRRAAFLADRTPITTTNNQMTITNIPNN